MAGNIIHYFAGGHTAKGYYPLFTSNFQGLEKVFFLKGSPINEKSALMKKLAYVWNNKGFDVEMIHSSSDHNRLDALIIPQLKIGLYDGTADAFEANAPSEEHVNIDEALDSHSLSDQKATISHYENQITETYQSAHTAFETGLKIHDHLEEIYINEMDFDEADQLTNELIDHLFAHQPSSGENPPMKHRFFGASTPEGVVDYIPNITEGLEKRYFIKGRAGTGKSTLLKKIAAAAQDFGLPVEMYHCGFDPESIDMVVVRKLGFCIFDSTDPHEYFPEREGDEIIDIYERAVTPGTDEKYEKDITQYNQDYKSYMKKGISILKEAKRLQDKLEEIYEGAIDNKEIDQLFKSIDLKIEEQANQLYSSSQD